MIIFKDSNGKKVLQQNENYLTDLKFDNQSTFDPTIYMKLQLKFVHYCGRTDTNEQTIYSFLFQNTS
jgi:hypothetical protein